MLKRSGRYALISMVPILLVVAWIYGFMYLVGYRINMVTATIAAISIGVGVDYATHFTVRFIEEFEHEPSRFPALRACRRGHGRCARHLSGHVDDRLLGDGLGADADVRHVRCADGGDDRLLVAGVVARIAEFVDAHHSVSQGRGAGGAHRRGDATAESSCTSRTSGQRPCARVGRAESVQLEAIGGVCHPRWPRRHTIQGPLVAVFASQDASGSPVIRCGHPSRWRS